MTKDVDKPSKGSEQDPLGGLEKSHADLLVVLENLESSTKRIERARREWTDALDAVRDLIFVHDHEFRVVRANRAYAERAGLSFQEMIGRPYWEVFPKGDGPLPGCVSVRNGVMEKTEEAITLETGETFQSRSFAIHDARGFYQHSIHILEDITERRRAEEALAESEAKLRTISESAQDAILMIDDRGKISFWNKTAETMFGYARDEALNKDMAELIVPARLREAHNKGLAAFQRTGQGAVIGKILELPSLRRDGTEFVAEHSISAVKLKGKWHAIGIARDVTPRKQVEEALRTSEARLRLQIDRMPIANIVWDPEFRVAAWNPAAERMFGFGAAEALGKHPYDLIVPKEVQSHTDVIWQRLLEGDETAHSINENLTKDGRRILCEWTNTPLKQADGAVVGVLSMAQDVTERKRAEAALARTNRALTALSACNTALIHASDETQLLEDICEIIIERGGYRMAWVGYAERDARKTVRPMAQAGHDAGYLESLDIVWDDTEHGHGPTGTAIRTGQPCVAQNISTDERFAPWRENALKRGYASSVTLPLIAGGQTLGALNVYAAEENAFDEGELGLLGELAADLAFGIVALRNTRQLRATLVDAIQAMALAVEKRDPYTAGHQQRVARLAVAIAGEMGLDAERIEGLRLSGIIHDLGKLYVPAEILSRPGRLTPAEFEIVKSHPQVGHDIIQGVKFPWPVAETILQHHERLDGSGYPRGLKGEQILLEARILAVADTVEAMVSHRPYRPGLGLDKALAEISACRGSLYEAAAVDACVKVIQEGRFRLDAA